ncbi:histidinol-phosphatase, partial [Dehalococcoides mccartyi]|nr:histidinol-phosphatase [Dehalococcoides mccartyi]
MSEPWKVSLHGGHSGDFCEHGHDTLREILEAAVAFGFTTFGVTAHAPAASDSTDRRFLYEEEIAAGHSPDDLSKKFSDFASASAQFAINFGGQLEVLRGAEIEVVPEDSFADYASIIRTQYDFDYLIGSVHWVDEMPFDTSRADFDKAVANRGGLEPFLIRYYELVELMIEQVSPEIIGHIDLPRLFSDGAPEHESSSVVAIVDRVLQKAAATGAILDLNVSALRKGLTTPYPSPRIVKRATKLGVSFCFGDDSHSVT